MTDYSIEFADVVTGINLERGFQRFVFTWGNHIVSAPRFSAVFQFVACVCILLHWSAFVCIVCIGSIIQFTDSAFVDWYPCRHKLTPQNVRDGLAMAYMPIALTLQ